ncbi:MAG: response regulator [Lachnospiraceae bacterium]|nr:response regulator [Lachnospiraceae bacterium]
MKTVIIIGKMNKLMKDLNDYLKIYFQVQICADDINNAEGMLKVVEPDLIMINLMGYTAGERDLFKTIQINFPTFPVITIGTEAEQKIFADFYSGVQFENLVRPLENTVILSAICKRLGISEQEVKENANLPKDNRPKILAVDDNMSILRNIKSILEEKYNVSLANSGMKAMNMIGKSRPDLILLDYEMPVVDGKQTLEMIRADEDIKDIPVIFLTGVNDENHIRAVLALKPARYLLKPVIPEKVIDAIETVLKNK